MRSPPVLQAPVSHWTSLRGARFRPLDSGLINRSWLALRNDRPIGVLQQLNTRIFQPTVHLDIEAVTHHLQARGVPTPHLVRTDLGDLWATVGDDVWRVLTPIGSDTHVRLPGPGAAVSAGSLVARFHAAVADLDYTFQHVRPGPHDTERHAAFLRAALAAHFNHPLFDQVAPLALHLLNVWDRLRNELPSELPRRIIHGDLKLTNLRFTRNDAVALIDLDTLQHGTLDAELGDAFRSWCATGNEDTAGNTIDLGVLGFALHGYAAGLGALQLTDDEWAAIVPGIQRISLELAMRFAADALHQTYFGWDPKRYATAGHHNLARATSQAQLAASVATHRAAADQIVRRARARQR